MILYRSSIKIQDKDIVANKDQKGSIGSPQEGILQFQLSFRSQCSDSAELVCCVCFPPLIFQCTT